MHLSMNEGIERSRFVVTGGLGFVGSALCLEHVSGGRMRFGSSTPRPSSPWSVDLLKSGVWIIQGSPVNSFEFIVGPLLKSLDYDAPKITLEVKHAVLMARIIWFVYTMLYPWLNRSWLPRPLVLPAEVHKIGVTHYFSFLKAREELGYVPMVSPRDGLAATISYWKDRKRRELDGPTIFAWLFAVVGMIAVFCAAYLPPVGPLKWLQAFSLFFRSLGTLRLVFVIAVALHVGEAICAWYLARRVDPRNSKGWFRQTFALGFFSLRLLLKRARSLGHCSSLF